MSLKTSLILKVWKSPDLLDKFHPWKWLKFAPDQDYMCSIFVARICSDFSTPPDWFIRINWLGSSAFTQSDDEDHRMNVQKTAILAGGLASLMQIQIYNKGWQSHVLTTCWAALWSPCLVMRHHNDDDYDEISWSWSYNYEHSDDDGFEGKDSNSHCRLSISNVAAADNQWFYMNFLIIIITIVIIIIMIIFVIVAATHG